MRVIRLSDRRNERLISILLTIVILQFNYNLDKTKTLPANLPFVRTNLYYQDCNKGNFTRTHMLRQVAQFYYLPI